MPLEPNTPGAEGVVDRAWNSLNPERAKKERDRRARERELVKKLFILAPDGTPIGATADVEMIQVMIEKFVKGITWKEDRLYIDDRRYEIQWHLGKENSVPDIFKTARASVHSLGEAIAIRRVTSDNGDRRVGFFEIVLWNHYYFVATCNLRGKYLGQNSNVYAAKSSRAARDENSD